VSLLIRGHVEHFGEFLSELTIETRWRVMVKWLVTVNVWMNVTVSRQSATAVVRRYTRRQITCGGAVQSCGACGTGTYSSSPTSSRNSRRITTDRPSVRPIVRPSRVLSSTAVAWNVVVCRALTTNSVRYYRQLLTPSNRRSGAQLRRRRRRSVYYTVVVSRPVCGHRANR